MTAVPGGPIHLADLRGRRVALYFFPKAGTAGCNAQACALRDRPPRGVDLFGASPDYPDSLAVFRQTWALPFPILSDPDLSLARRYGVVRGFLQPFVERTVFLLDRSGNVERVASGVDPLASPEVIRRWLDAGTGG